MPSVPSCSGCLFSDPGLAAELIEIECAVEAGCNNCVGDALRREISNELEAMQNDLEGQS